MDADRRRPALLEGERDLTELPESEEFIFEPHGVDPTGKGRHPGRHLIITSHRFLWQTTTEAGKDAWAALKLDKVAHSEVTGGFLRSWRVQIYLQSGASIAVKCTGAQAPMQASGICQTLVKAVQEASVRTQTLQNAGNVNAVQQEQLAEQDFGPNESTEVVAQSGQVIAAAAPNAQLTQSQAAAVALDKQIALVDERILKIEEEVKQVVQKSNPAAKAQALQLLKRKKMYVEQRERFMNQQLTLVGLEDQKEQAQMNQVIVSTMAQAQAAMQNLHVDVEQVDRLQDELREVQDDMQDIGQALAMAGGMNVDEDEAAAAEFARLQEELALEQLAQGGGSSTAAAAPDQMLADVGSSPLPEKTDSDAFKDLRSLPS